MGEVQRELPPAKRALLSEGLKLFASHGVDAVSVRDIARATGFSNPVLFRHFASKEALAAALFETCYRQLVEALDSAAARRGA
jgi:AcrR family transcriptional regulator